MIVWRILKKLSVTVPGWARSSITIIMGVSAKEKAT
jgi:hypothetical protein